MNPYCLFDSLKNKTGVDPESPLPPYDDHEDKEDEQWQREATRWSLFLFLFFHSVFNRRSGVGKKQNEKKIYFVEHNLQFFKKL